MDHVVHINDGSAKAEAKPIVLRLIPGEEETLRLKVVNHGKPSNISLEIGGQIIEAVHPERQEQYVAEEETIPVIARMPDVDMLEGELLLVGEEGRSRVPVTLIRDSESEGEWENNSSWGERMEFTDKEREEIEERSEKVDDEDLENLEDSDASAASEAEDADDESEESSRIKFSRDKDLERYRASRRHRGIADYRAADYRDQRGDVQAQAEEALSHEYEYADSTDDRERDAENAAENASEDTAEDAVPGFGEGARSRLFEFSGDKSALLAVPTILLVALIALLILTFYSESIPEFSGALASSMLIVTLIIYGAATLLKA